jgi:hypothetical protein
LRQDAGNRGTCWEAGERFDLDVAEHQVLYDSGLLACVSGLT